MSLRDKVVAEITTVNAIAGEYIYTDLILPATAMQIEDALQKARITDSYDDMTVSIINCPYLPELTNTRIYGVSIKELNLFANRVTMLSENEIIALNGIFLNQNAQGKYDDGISMKELINLTYGLQAVPVVKNISTDKQLGQFVIDNDLNEEIVKMSDDAVEMLDRATIGKQHREAECGEFLAGCYVATAVYQFPQQYTRGTGEWLKFENTGVFALYVAEAPVNDSMENAKSAEKIYLPIPKSRANGIAEDHNESCIEDCVYYGFESAIKEIDGQIFGDMQDFDKLNDIAERYVSYSQPDRVKFKAVIESESPQSLDEITDIAKNLRKYKLAYYADTADAFAKDYLAHNLPKSFDMNFFKQTDLTRLGKALAKRLGASFTEYGVISARGKRLYDIVPCGDEQTEKQTEKQTEEMGGMQM